MDQQFTELSVAPELTSRSKFSLLQLAYGEVLAPRVHSQQSLMVLYAGEGTIIGDVEREVAKDDVVLLPPGCAYGVIGGPNGLLALSIRLGDDPYDMRDVAHGFERFRRP